MAGHKFLSRAKVNKMVSTPPNILPLCTCKMRTGVSAGCASVVCGALACSTVLEETLTAMDFIIEAAYDRLRPGQRRNPTASVRLCRTESVALPNRRQPPILTQGAYC